MLWQCYPGRHPENLQEAAEDSEHCQNMYDCPLMLAVDVPRGA